MADDASLSIIARLMAHRPIEGSYAWSFLTLSEFGRFTATISNKFVYKASRTAEIWADTYFEALRNGVAKSGGYINPVSADGNSTWFGWNRDNCKTVSNYYCNEEHDELGWLPQFKTIPRGTRPVDLVAGAVSWLCCSCGAYTSHVHQVLGVRVCHDCTGKHARFKVAV